MAQRLANSAGANVWPKYSEATYASRNEDLDADENDKILIDKVK